MQPAASYLCGTPCACLGLLNQQQPRGTEQKSLHQVRLATSVTPQSSVHPIKGWNPMSPLATMDTCLPWASGTLQQKYSRASIQVHGCAFPFLFDQIFHLPPSRQATIQGYTHNQIWEATTRISHANTISGCTKVQAVINSYIHITKGTSLLCWQQHTRACIRHAHTMSRLDNFSVNYACAECRTQMHDHCPSSAPLVFFFFISVYETLSVYNL